MNWKGGAETVCPYYERESKYTITCEGVYGGTELVTRFKRAEDKSHWQERICYDLSRCCLCPVHNLLDEKYITLSSAPATK